MPRRKTGKKTKRTRRTAYGGSTTRNLMHARFNLHTKDMHSFKRVCPFSNSAFLGVTGTLSKSTDALLMTMASIGTSIQYGAFGLKFGLADVVNSTEFTLLFDQYRITGVKVKMFPFYTETTTGAAVSATSAQTTILVHSIIDLDDASTPTATDAGISEIRQYASYRCHNLSQGKGYFARSIRPRMATPVYAAGAFSAYAQAPMKIWVDCQNPDAEYYGLKCIFEANNSGANTVLYVKCETTYYLQLKNVR